MLLFNAYSVTVPALKFSEVLTNKNLYTAVSFTLTVMFPISPFASFTFQTSEDLVGLLTPVTAVVPEAPFEAIAKNLLSALKVAVLDALSAAMELPNEMVILPPLTAVDCF